MKKQTEPPREPFRYGDDYPWNPDLDHEETLRIIKQLGLKSAKTSSGRQWRRPRLATQLKVSEPEPRTCVGRC
jgi:hypothetical protein